MNRRAFLRHTAVAAISSAVPCALSATRLHGSSHVREHIAVTTYPFRGYIVAPANNRRDPSLPGWDLPHFIRFVVSEYDLRAVEILDKHFAGTDSAYLDTVQKTLQQEKVKLVNIPVDNKIRFCGGSAEERAEALRTHRLWIDIAARFGCPGIRPRVPSPSPTILDMDCAVDTLRRLAEYGESKGVIVNLENDNPVVEAYPTLVRILERVNSPFLRALPDFANSLAGGDQAYNVAAMKALFPFAKTITHAKDWEHIHGVPQTLDMREIVEIARRSGFNGWYSIESDSADDARNDTHHILTKLVRSLEAPLA